MNEAELERRFLEFVYTTDATITPSAVAFFAECTIERAEALLDRMTRNGTLRLEHDAEGNLFYVFPNRRRIEKPGALAPQPGTPASQTLAPSWPPPAASVTVGHAWPAAPAQAAQGVASFQGSGPADGSALAPGSTPVGPGTPLMQVGGVVSPLAGTPSTPGASVPHVPHSTPVAGVPTAEGTIACPFCAEPILSAAKKCKHCGEILDPGLRAARAVPVQVNLGIQNVPAPMPAPSRPVPVRYLNPGTAGVLSFVWPGAGQIYTGRVGAGIGWMIGTFLGYLLFIIPGVLLHILCIFSAVRAAREENGKYGQT